MATQHQIGILQNDELCYLPIKPNLYDALLRLRRDFPPKGSMILWVGVLCIHQVGIFSQDLSPASLTGKQQTNVPEKNAQIRKMAMIYHSATRVCVWLGNEKQEDKSAIEFIHRLLKLEDFDPLTRDPGTPIEWDAFNKLMQRPWFHRRWIMQEISLARKATLFCGSQSVSWEHFYSAVSLFVARYRDLRPLFQSSAQFHNHPNYLGEVDALGAKALVDITTNLFRKAEDGFILERLFSLEALISTMTLFEASSPHDTIYSVLWLAHDAEPDSKDVAAMSLEPVIRTPKMSPELISGASSDDDVNSPRLLAGPGQAIYTASPISESHAEAGSARMPLTPSQTVLLEPPRMNTKRSIRRSATDTSLSEAESMFDVERPQSITVDYNQDTFAVFQQFLNHTITRSLSIDILCHPWAPKPLRTEVDLPSWIPQLSNSPFEKAPGTNTYSRVRADPLVGRPGFGSKCYNASGKTKMYPEKGFICGRTLIVTGFPLDDIKTISAPAMEGILPYAWMKLVDWDGSPDELPDRFWRTLVADRGIGVQVYPPAYFPLACKWVFKRRSQRSHVNTSTFLTHGKCPSIVTEFLTRVQCVIWGRKLALTAGKYGSQPLLVLLPDEAEKRDTICILHGCSVPVVLRREKKRSSEQDLARPKKIPKMEKDHSDASFASAPTISLTAASKTPSLERTPGTLRPVPTSHTLTVEPEEPDIAFASTGIRRAIRPSPIETEPSRLPISLDSTQRYKLNAMCTG